MTVAVVVVAGGGLRERRRRRQRRQGRPQREPRMVMQFEIVRGRAAAADPVIMNTKVWRNMPEETMWEVLRFVPAVKLFQWRLVSRKWRQELTSPRFWKIHKAAEQQEEPLVACVQGRPSRASSYSDHDANCKVLEVNLWTFVPSSFWSGGAELPHSCRVVAAAHGLVCISNNSERHHISAWAERVELGSNEKMPIRGPGHPWSNRYCVLNPLTRTCTVLPEPPFRVYTWLLPTSTSVAILGLSSVRPPYTWPPPFTWHSATYDLTAAGGGGGGGGGGGWVSGHKLDVPRELRERMWLEPVAALLGGGSGGAGGGQVFWYTDHDNRVHVTEAGGVEVGALDAPSVTRLDLRLGKRQSALIAHRGAIYFVAKLRPLPLRPRRLEDAVLGVWRLATTDVDARMEWEEVAWLHQAELDRLAGSRCGDAQLSHAYCVGQLVCCQLMEWQWYKDDDDDDDDDDATVPYALLGFNLDTHKWELVYGSSTGTAFQLRPDSFLSS